MSLEIKASETLLRFPPPNLTPACKTWQVLVLGFTVLDERRTGIPPGTTFSMGIRRVCLMLLTAPMEALTNLRSRVNLTFSNRLVFVFIVRPTAIPGPQGVIGQAGSRHTLTILWGMCKWVTLLPHWELSLPSRLSVVLQLWSVRLHTGIRRMRPRRLLLPRVMAVL